MTAGAGRPAEEGYQFTPLPTAVRRVVRPQAVFDRRLPDHINGRVELEYQAHQPVHVGSGAKVMIDGAVARGAVRAGDRLIIPGSSFKGMIRARFEAITCSCTGSFAPMKGRQRRIVSSSYNGWDVELDRGVTNHDVFQPCRASGRVPTLCAACALFGVMNRRSRVLFDDLITSATAAVDHMPVQFGPRLHHCGEFTPNSGGRLLRVIRLYGRKFHGGAGPRVPKRQLVEVIPVGAVLKGAVRFSNLTHAELGGLLTALGIVPGSYLKAGGGKPLGFGLIAPKSVSLDLRDASRRPVSVEVAGLREAFVGSPDRHAVGETAMVAIHNRPGW